MSDTPPVAGAIEKVQRSSPRASGPLPLTSSVPLEGPHDPPIDIVLQAVPSKVAMACAISAAIARVSISSGTPPGRRDSRIRARIVSASKGWPDSIGAQLGAGGDGGGSGAPHAVRRIARNAAAMRGTTVDRAGHTGGGGQSP